MKLLVLISIITNGILNNIEVRFEALATDIAPLQFAEELLALFISEFPLYIFITH